MSAVSPARIFDLQYQFLDHQLESGDLTQDIPQCPEKIEFIAVNSLNPPCPLPAPVFKLIDTLVRTYIFEKKCHLESSLQLTLGLSQDGIKFLCVRNDLKENKDFMAFVKKTMFSGPLDESFRDEILVMLKVRLLKPLRMPLGLSTGYLRYPHMLRDMWIRFAFDRFREDVNVCIIGPGLYKAPTLDNTCPQFVEILALFEKATFTLLDVDPISLNALRESLHSRKIALYDPSTLCKVTNDDPKGRSPLRMAPEEYTSVLSLIKRGLVSKTVDSIKNHDMLNGIGQLEALSLNVDPSKINITEYDTLSSEMVTVEGGYDVIVATHSISNAYFSAKEKGLEFDSPAAFESILSSLKRGGALYLDTTGYGSITKAIESKTQTVFHAYIHTIELKLNTKFRFDTASLTSYFKNEPSSKATASFCLLDEDHQVRNIACGSIIVITRTFDTPFRPSGAFAMESM